MCVLDQTRDVGNREVRAQLASGVVQRVLQTATLVVKDHSADIGRESSEGPVADTGATAGECTKERALACNGQADQSNVRK